MVVDAKNYDTVSNVGADLVMVVNSVIRDYVRNLIFFSIKSLLKVAVNLDSLDGFFFR